MVESERTHTSGAEDVASSSPSAGSTDDRIVGPKPSDWPASYAMQTLPDAYGTGNSPGVFVNQQNGQSFIVRDGKAYGVIYDAGNATFRVQDAAAPSRPSYPVRLDAVAGQWKFNGDTGLKGGGGDHGKADLSWVDQRAMDLGQQQEQLRQQEAQLVEQQRQLLERVHELRATRAGIVQQGRGLAQHVREAEQLVQRSQQRLQNVRSQIQRGEKGREWEERMLAQELPGLQRELQQKQQQLQQHLQQQEQRQQALHQIEQERDQVVLQLLRLTDELHAIDEQLHVLEQMHQP
jgi:hypothetical protein